jgi:hypothetical protein
MPPVPKKRPWKAPDVSLVEIKQTLEVSVVARLIKTKAEAAWVTTPDDLIPDAGAPAVRTGIASTQRFWSCVSIFDRKNLHGASAYDK